MKIIIAPDKFKGSLTSVEVCIAIRTGILQADDQIKVLVFPMADGGDGFAEVLKYYLQTETKYLQSVDPLGRIISSSYEWKEEDLTAIVELASCSGLVLLEKEERNPLYTSTYGTGLQIRHAIELRAKKIILGLGGSATNDAGMGILTALGFGFLDLDDKELTPCGENLLSIKKIIVPCELPDVQIEIACDVDNPLYGPEGAAFIFSPQKGATEKQVEILDMGLKNFAQVIRQHTGKDVASIPGTGAAGGIAAGLMAYLNVTLIAGTELIMNASGIKNSIGNADFVITGEGKIDQQSFRGKVVSAIAELAKEKNKPVAGICGKLELDPTEWKDLGLVLAEELIDASVTEEESMKMASMLLIKKARSIVTIIKEICKDESSK